MIVCDAGLCTDCAKCIKVCPTGALKFPGDVENATASLSASSNGSGPTGSRLTGGGWSSSTVREIQEKARTGKHIVRGCGTTRKLPTFDDLVLLSAGLSRMPVDTYRETAVTRTVLGARPGGARKPLVVETPIMVAAMSYGALSKEAKIALAMGSAKVGTAMNNGEGGLLPEERQHSYRQIVQVCPSRFGFSLRNLEEADAIELVFGIGAKPELRARLNVKLAAHRVANYFTALTNELVILAKACGKSNVHNLEREDLRAVTLEACAMTGIPFIGSDYTFTEPFGFFG